MKSVTINGHKITMAFSIINSAWLVWHTIGGQQFKPEIYQAKRDAQLKFREKVDFLKAATGVEK